MSSEKIERWQTKITCLKQAISQIYETNEFSDVTFVVKGHVIFKGHRLVLASRSPEFARQLLCSNSPEQFIVDETVTETGFKILLRFIYKDVIGTADKRSIIEAYIAALHYKQRTLQAKCEDQIKSWVLEVDEALELLEVGSDVPALKQRCLNFIRNNALKVIASPSFLNISLKTLAAILHSGCLNHVSARDRISCVMKWGRNHYSDAEDYSVVRNELLACDKSPLSKLGFETLDLQDISFVVNNYVNFLDSKEVMNLIMYCSNKDVSLLPKWCTDTVQKTD